MLEFADWLASTPLSATIVNNLWMIPAIQSVHIIAIGLLVGALLMLDMRVLGLLSKDQTVTQVNDRYAPWIWGAIVVLAISGCLLIVGEPRRELLSFSFWVKMTLLAIGIAIVLAFQFYLKANAAMWKDTGEPTPLTKFFAILSICIWVAIIFLGRFIAWDAQIWGSLSPQA
jgi:putative copper export protein